MSFLDYHLKSNILLIRRYEAASGYSPLALMPQREMKGIVLRVREAANWEDLPLSDRKIIESSEENRREAMKNPQAFDTSKI